MEKYFVVDEAIRGGDTFIDMFDSLEEANKAAEHDWNHLTSGEQRKRHIFVAWVTPDMLTDEDDWDSWHSLDFDDRCFDSANF